MINGPFTVWPHGWVGTEKNGDNNKHPHAKRRGRVRPTARGGKGAGMKEFNPDTKLEEATREMLWEQHPVRYTGNIQIGVNFYYDARTTVDLDNLLKHIWDSMNGWWFKDDSQITRVLNTEILYDKANPRAEVVIGEIPDDEVGRLGMMPRGRNWDPTWDPYSEALAAVGPFIELEEWNEGLRTKPAAFGSV